MSQNMNLDFGLDTLLDPDSDLIQDLCEELEEKGIHLTYELLSEILVSYEETKFEFFKEIIEQAMGGEDLSTLSGGPSVIQVMVDPREKEKSKDSLDDVDTKYLS